MRSLWRSKQFYKISKKENKNKNTKQKKIISEEPFKKFENPVKNELKVNITR